MSISVSLPRLSLPSDSTSSSHEILDAFLSYQSGQGCMYFEGSFSYSNCGSPLNPEFTEHPPAPFMPVPPSLSGLRPLNFPYGDTEAPQSVGGIHFLGRDILALMLFHPQWSVSAWTASLFLAPLFLQHRENMTPPTGRVPEPNTPPSPTKAREEVALRTRSRLIIFTPQTLGHTDRHIDTHRA